MIMVDVSNNKDIYHTNKHGRNRNILEKLNVRQNSHKLFPWEKHGNCKMTALIAFP